MYNCLTVVFLSIPSDIERDLIGIIYTQRERERKREREREWSVIERNNYWGKLVLENKMYINSIAQRRLCDHLS